MGQSPFEKLRVLRPIRKAPRCVRPDSSIPSSIPCSQQSATWSHPGPDQSSSKNTNLYNITWPSRVQFCL